MSGADGVIAFIGAMLLMIMVHEYGHFSTARLFGIRVDEFFLGFGPTLFSFRKGETEFGMKAFLLGGYVRIAGMNPWEKVPDEELPRTFGAKPAWQRAIVLLAGSTTHFIMAAFMIFLMAGFIGLESPATTVGQVEKEIEGKPAPAVVAGLQKGDKIVTIDGAPIKTWEDISNQFRSRAGQTIPVEVERDGKVIALQMTPVEGDVPLAEDPTKTERVGRVGIRPEFIPRKMPIPQAAVYSVKATGAFIVVSAKTLPTVFGKDGISAVFRAIRDGDDATGPRPVGLVGAGRVTAQLTAAGEAESLIFFLIYFIVFIGVVNLVPLLPLDGGHLAVVLWEAVTRKKVDMRKLVPVSAVVIGLLLILFVALLYLDIWRPMQFF
ncbi:MAG TPA: M50 family metallopeptidase [Actinomycetota bacterium]|nr:M50 family metallopeptidase [Actinomycetota bacterium]